MRVLTGSLVRHARPDWFVISDDQAKQLAQAPSVWHDDRADVWAAHRSHLPLLEAVGDSSNVAFVESSVGRPPPFTFDDGSELRDYQLVGKDFIEGRRGTLLGDGCRVGKTPQIVASHDFAMGPLVVVGPLAVRGVWLDWFRRRWPDREAVVLRGRKYFPTKVLDADLIFAHYDILPAWQSVGLRRKIGTLVFDEVHLCSNRMSKRSQAALIMAPSAERIICATGTPLWNKPSGLWPILAMTNPGAWGTFYKWTERYSSGGPGQYGWTTGDPSFVEELQTRLSEVYLARRWSDIRDELPPTIRTVETADFSSRDELALDKIAATLRDELHGGAALASPTVVGELARYRRLISGAKARVAAKLAQQVADEGDRVVVWVWHRDAADVVRKGIRNHRVYIVTGDTPMNSRDDILDKWRASDAGVLIISMGVAPAGIDLSQSAHCIVAELDWTPATLGQCVMRTYSPDRPNFETYVVADHEVDHKLLEVLVQKCDHAQQMGLSATDTADDVFTDVFSQEPDEGGTLADLAERISKAVAEGAHV